MQSESRYRLRQKHRTLLTNSGKAQAAIEYLSTYWWAILIIAVSAATLYTLGVFNTAKYVSTTCVLPSKLNCLGATLAYNGNLLVNIGQSAAPSITLTSVGCNTNSTPSNIMQLLATPVNIIIGGNATIVVQCYDRGIAASRPQGTLYSGYLIVDYTNPSSDFSHIAIGPLIIKASTPNVIR